MTTRYGKDLVLDEDGDLVTANGDLLDTSTLENISSETFQFEGQYNMRTSIYRRLMTLKGQFQFDIDFGSELMKYVGSTSQNIIEVTKEIVRETLAEDSRVKETRAIEVTKDGNYLNIKISLILIGSNQVSTFVYPDIYVG